MQTIRKIPIKIDDDLEIFVEVSNQLRDQDVGIKEALKFESIRRGIKAISKSLCSTINDVKPDKASIEFGLDFSIKGSNIIVGIAGENKANIKVKMEWDKKLE